MRALYKAQLRAVRAQGYDVFVVPGDEIPMGVAWTEGGPDGGPERLITLVGDVDSDLWLFVLFHEWAHHDLGHTVGWTSVPVWMIEKAADDAAMAAIRAVQPSAVAVCEAATRTHIGGLMQAYIDHDIWIHVDLGVADWAGCVVPADMRQMLMGVQP